MNINTNNNLLSLYTTMYQGNVALFSNRLNRNHFPLPGNNAQSSQSLGADTVSFINNIRAGANALTGAIRDLSRASSSRTVTSSDTDVLTASLGQWSGSISPMRVRVEQTAAGQLNEGARMGADAEYQGSAGTNRFAIEAGGRTTELSVTVREGDTNRDVQQRMADAINSAGAGVRATVETDSETNTSVLRLEATATGSDPARSGFTISDRTGDLVAQTGADAVSSEGRDARFSVNGGAVRTSQSNTVYLASGVSATFNMASDEEVTITPGRDAANLASAVEGLVKSYNDLYIEAVRRTDDPRSQNLASRMLRTVGTYGNTLSRLGIGMDSEGRMTIDSDRLNQAAESGRLDQFFTERSGRNFGFTHQLGRIADNVSRNPGNFVSSSMFGSSLSQNFAYSSFGDLIQYNFLSAGSVMDFML